MSETPEYTTADLAELWGVSQGFVRDQVRDGKLCASVRLASGTRTIYRFSELDVSAYDPSPATLTRLRRIRERAERAERADDKNTDAS